MQQDRKASAPMGWTMRRVAGALLLFGAMIFWAVHKVTASELSLVPIQGFILAMLVSAVSLLTAAWRMQALSDGRIGVSAGCKSIALVSSVLIAFPSRMSDLVKPVYLAERVALELPKGFSVLFFERALDVFVVVGMLGLLLIGQGTEAGAALWGSAGMLATIGVGLALVIGALIAAPGSLLRAAHMLPTHWLKRTAGHLLDAMTETTSTQVLFKGAALSVLAWLNSYMIFYVYLTALALPEAAIHIDAWIVLLAFVAGSLGLFVTVTPGGIGTYELAIALALNGYGIPLAEGVVHGFMLRLVVLVPNLVLLLHMLLFDHFDFAGLYRRLQQTHVAQQKTGDAA